MQIESNLDKIFVSSYIAIKLKELGFDEECLAYYHNHVELDLVKNNNFTKNSEQNLYHGDCAAPTWEQVIDWLESNYSINISINPSVEVFEGSLTVMSISGYSFIIKSLKQDTDLNDYFHSECFKTKEEARKEAILKIINIIEDEVRSNLGEVPANS